MLHIINEMPIEVKEFCEKAMKNTCFEFTIMKDFIDRGSHGTVYNILDTDYVIKFFNEKAVAGGYLDYIYLESLQGIDAVPVLYAYADKRFMVIEKIKGITILDYFLKNGKYPKGIRKMIQDSLMEIGQRKIVPYDLKTTEDIFWVEEGQKIKLIDFGVCSNYSNLSDDLINRSIQGTIKCVFDDLDMYEKLK